MRTIEDLSTPQIAGWAVSGAEMNQNAKIVYLTDGLLKERLTYDANFIMRTAELNKSIVVFLDEVHERSINIDHCLALLARLLTLRPELRSKIKLIISSATLDASVPALFHRISNLKCSKFEMPSMGTLHTVTKVARPNANILNVVQELYQERRRHDQILCFVSSVKEVNEYCDLIKKITGGAITAYPLVQSQRSSVQQDYIDNKSVFFSTTVAETSLTFPQLRYVIDTGMINLPIYDSNLKRTVLRTVQAAESTIKQRLGRLGRTQPGVYYSLYDFNVEDKKYPTPQICYSDLMNIEFSLRKSPIQQGLSYMKDFLPDSPPQLIIDHTIEQLVQLGLFSFLFYDRRRK
jgi:ATP-dependent helicase HrpA